MKGFLMHRDRDFDLEAELPSNTADLLQDLSVPTLLKAMAGGDDFLYDIAGKGVLGSLADPQEVIYRQQVLTDCMEHASVVREIYGLSVEAIEGEKKIFHSLFSKYPDAVLHRATESLELLVGVLRRLRRLADSSGPSFSSPGSDGSLPC